MRLGQIRELPVQRMDVTRRQLAWLPAGFTYQSGAPIESAQNVHLRDLVPPPSPHGERLRKLASRDKSYDVVTRRLLEHPADVSLPATFDLPLHGATLVALNEIRVVAEDRKPEGEVGIGDLVQRIRGRRSAVRTHRSHVSRLAEPVEGVVDPLLRTACDARPSPVPRTERTEHALVPTPPVEILPEDVQRVAQQHPAGSERQLTEILRRREVRLPSP